MSGKRGYLRSTRLYRGLIRMSLLERAVISGFATGAVACERFLWLVMRWTSRQRPSLLSARRIVLGGGFATGSALVLLERHKNHLFWNKLCSQHRHAAKLWQQRTSVRRIGIDATGIK